MFDDLATYYHENVILAFAEYRDVRDSGIAGSSRDLRKALAAATALFHLREHLPAGSLSRTAAEAKCPDYGLLGDIVNASKHKTISAPTPHGAPLLSDATQLTEEVIVTQYEDEQGEYTHSEKAVVVQLSNGTERNLLEVLTNVVNFWEQYLTSIGVIQKARTFAYPDGPQPRSRRECEQLKKIVVTKGQRLRQAFRLQRFNYETNRVEAIDLTGTQARGSIYRPRYEVDVILTHNASGEELKKSITLNGADSLTLERLQTDEERQAFLQSLPSWQEALRELAIQAGRVEPPSSTHAAEESDR